MSKGRVFKRGRNAVKGRGNGVRKARNNQRPVQKLERNESNKLEIIDIDVNKNTSDYFSKNASFEQHYEAQEKNRDKYLATALAFNEYSIEIIPNSRARSLAAAFARHDKDLIDFYLNKQKQFGLSDVVKASSILDSRRQKKAIEKKIERIEKSSGKPVKAKRLGKLKNDINNLEKLRPKIETRSFGCSGAMARQIRKWTQKFTEKELEFFCLSLPTEPWKKLADIFHLNPRKDLQAEWFLPYCFGEPLPKDSRIEKLKNMTENNVNELIKEYDNIPFSYLKKFANKLNEESKEKIALQQDKLDTIIWYYEDIACKKVDDVIKARLEKGDKIELGYGKLMERLLLLKDIKEGNKLNHLNLKDSDSSESLFSLLISKAEDQLKNFKATIPSPVAVLGDASGSMEVAIRTSTIISSLLAAICQAKLTFFNDKNFESKLDPKDIKDVIQIAYTTRAHNSTAPAASLVPYYNKKEIIKTFIIVTDEEENANGTTADGKTWRFYELFMEYRKNVYPAQLIFVSFLNSQHSEGDMYRRFVRDNVEDVLQFKFDRSRPDLTKLDGILGSICSKSSESFSGLVEKIESDIKTMGLIQTFDKLNANLTV